MICPQRRQRPQPPSRAADAETVRKLSLALPIAMSAVGCPAAPLGGGAYAGGCPAAASRSVAPSGQGGPLEIDITQGTLKPIPIAIPEFLGEDPQLCARRRRTWSPPTWSARACSSRSTAPRSSSGSAIVNAPPRFQDWRVVQRSSARRRQAVAHAADGRLVAEFRLWDVASGRQLAGQRFASSAAELAPRRPHHRRPGLPAADRREGLLRHARRLRRRDGPQGPPHQAARHHGPGRRQRAAAEPGAGARADAALQPDQPGNHLHVSTRAISRACSS